MSTDEVTLQRTETKNQESENDGYSVTFSLFPDLFVCLFAFHLHQHTNSFLC